MATQSTVITTDANTVASEPFFWSWGRSLIRKFYDRRGEEYDFAWTHLKNASRIADIACGTGTFMERAPARMDGFDINPDNVAYCHAHGLNAQLGNALELPCAGASYDGVHSSHVLQVFTPDQAVRYVRELFRICKPGGLVVIVSLNAHKFFWRHPENVRPYQPIAILDMFARQRDEQSPMWADIPAMPDVVALRLRHPPLIEFQSTTSQNLRRFGSVLNALQYGLYLRKYWKYDAYTLVLRKR